MKRAYLRTMIVAALVVLAVNLSARAGSNGQGRGNPRYDPATEETLTGIVGEVSEQTCRNCGFQGPGIHFAFESEGQVIEVHVGPASFLQKGKFTISKGDRLEVVGSRVPMSGKDVLLAREIKKGDTRFTLRDSRGVPAWSGRRR